MASICLTQSNFQQHHHLQQQFQLMNGNMLLLQQQQHQTTAYNNNKQQQRIAPQPTATKILGTSHLQNIQPTAAINGSSVGSMLTKKKFGYNPMPYGEPLPSVARRNARERNRVKQVNNGFSNLRQHLPQTVINALSSGGRGASKKLSKVDTLRIAVEYIRGLQDLLDDDNENDDCGIKPSTAGPIFLMDDVSNDGYSSVGSPIDCKHFPQLSQSYHSEASASPTPSYTDSDISIGGVNYLQPIALESPQQQQQAAPEAEQTVQFKYEPFDNYGQLANDEQPDDEELLDYISLWQEQ